MTKHQFAAIQILQSLERMVRYDGFDAKIIRERLDVMLDDLRDEDFFGTEGQNDPRGDGREED